MYENCNEEESLPFEDEEEILSLALDDSVSPRQSKHIERKKRRMAMLDRIFGEDIKVNSTVFLPSYYAGLLSWALMCHIAEAGWKVIQTTGYHDETPDYLDVETRRGEKQNLIWSGILVMEKDGEVLVATRDNYPHGGPAVLIVTGPERRKEAIEQFAKDVKTIANERNFYRGQALDFYGRIFFLDTPNKSWSQLILDQDTKDAIWANTIGFIQNRSELRSYGIPTKRGVILVGRPGTGKTLACKALISAAKGITCITTRSDALENGSYLHDLYDLAEDLSPTIVMIEDIDLIAQDREESRYMRGSALMNLLSILDGVEERDGVVTIGSTNIKETLDQAISQRPSRFDAIITFPLPSLKLRVELISLLCSAIPLEEEAREYIARKTEGYTPSQIQEVVYSLVIDYCNSHIPQRPRPQTLVFSRAELDSAIARINRDNKGQTIGFNLPLNGNVKRCGVNTPASNERSE